MEKAGRKQKKRKARTREIGKEKNDENGAGEIQGKLNKRKLRIFAIYKIIVSASRSPPG